MCERRLILLAVLLLCLPSLSPGQVEVVESDSGFVLGNQHLRIRVHRAGGRIASLRDLRGGGELVSLWKGGGEIGGLLDDRMYFTGAAYEGAVEEDSVEVRLRLRVEHDSGLRLEKDISLRNGEPVVRVRYRLVNGGQQPVRLWVRNFPVPGGAPLGERHIYTLPLGEGTMRKPFASEYFADLRAPWAALGDTLSGSGLLAAVPGVEKFYFWQGSRQFPTFEWIYPETPAGKEMEAELALAVVHEEAPDWDGLADGLVADLRDLRYGDVAGWRDAAERFGLVAADSARGFWLSTGWGENKQRLPEVVELDLPLGGRRVCYLGIEPLVESRGVRLGAQVGGELAGWVVPAREVEEENAIVVEALEGSQEISLKPGEEQRIWLAADARGIEHGAYEDSLFLAVGERWVGVPVRVRVWPVAVPDERPFDVRGYATLGDFTGGYAVSDSSLQKLDALLGAYAEMGGSVFDWTTVWARVLEQVRIDSTDEILTQVAREDPGRLDLDALPALDFSHFDPWLEMARKHGVDRVETYMEYPESARWQWACLDPAVGEGRVAAGTEDAETVIVWLYGELRRYFESRGFRGFFCKIADEIAPEHVEEYARAARLARRAGWRPFTTVTGMVARTAEWVEAMNPHCDQWQVSLMLKDDFRELAAENPLARVDSEDEIWFYGGSSQPFRQAYENAARYPLLAAVEGVDGYGWWAFQWWQASEKVVWYAADSGVVRSGPAFLGLRDGWEDARLFHWVVRRLRALPERFAAGSGGALIELGEETSEVYRWTTITNLPSPAALNRVRRALLQAATQHLSTQRRLR